MKLVEAKFLDDGVIHGVQPADVADLFGGRLDKQKEHTRWQRKTWLDLIDIALEGPVPSPLRQYKITVAGAHVGSTALSAETTTTTHGWIPRSPVSAKRLEYGLTLRPQLSSPESDRNIKLANLANLQRKAGPFFLMGTFTFEGAFDDSGIKELDNVTVNDITPNEPKLGSAPEAAVTIEASSLHDAIGKLDVFLCTIPAVDRPYSPVSRALGLSHEHVARVTNLAGNQEKLSSLEVARQIISLAS